MRSQKIKTNIFKTISAIEDFFILFGLSLSILTIISTIVIRQLSVYDWIWNFEFLVHNSWAYELAIYSMLLSTFFGISKAYKKKSHITLDIFQPYLEKKFHIKIDVIKYQVLISFNIFLLFLGVYWTNFVFNSGQLSPDLSMPMWIVYAILPLTCVFSIFNLILNLLKK